MGLWASVSWRKRRRALGVWRQSQRPATGNSFNLQGTGGARGTTRSNRSYELGVMEPPDELFQVQSSLALF